MRSCRNDGRLINPDRPAVNIDSFFHQQVPSYLQSGLRIADGCATRRLDLEAPKGMFGPPIQPSTPTGMSAFLLSLASAVPTVLIPAAQLRPHL
jgi:hypothetical protein